jgi:prevent-host-death family protein
MKLSVTEIKANFYDLMEQVSRGTKLTATRYGRPIAHLVPPDILAVKQALKSRRKRARQRRAANP